jgi:hypothetical protein
MARRAPTPSPKDGRAAATPDVTHRGPDPSLGPATGRPDVYVDFTVEHGLLFIVLRNIGSASAYDVVTRFDQPFRGLGGRKDISCIALFRSLQFIPPGKQFTQLVDHIDAYFRREEPTRITASITYADRDGRRYTEAVPHDLEIYRDLDETLPR